ncbi:MAG: hypothetical protein ACI4UU_01845 [Clostridia bacterium]
MKKIRKIIGYIIMIIAIIALIVVYKKYNFNDFDKSVRESNKTVFTRDSSVKYSKMDSYKIENTDYNDSMFSQTISVIPNTPYKVTCMVKVENVENESNRTAGGAHISLVETGETSKIVNGTTDWEQLTLMFDSKNQTSIEIGFRLGGREETSKGIAWFSDFKVEIGSTFNNSKWNMACFIFPKIDVNVEVDGKTENVKLEMSDSDIRTVQTNLSRFKTSISEVSNNKMSIEYETYIINDPITTLSYDKENGYYVSASDVYKYINSYVEEKEYDHIYVAFRMADKQKGNSVLVNDWIGLGGMDYLGIGFSNIRMPDDRNNVVYEYNYRINTFPEEVFLHEFLHTLERNAMEYGYERPELHDYAKYGYKEDKTEGLKEWYADYMNKQIEYNGTKIGLPQDIYIHKPVHTSSFKYSRELDVLQEPKNIIEVIKGMFRRIGRVFEYSKNNIELEETK